MKWDRVVWGLCAAMVAAGCGEGEAIPSDTDGGADGGVDAGPGDGGTDAGSPECVDDVDCDDGNACNGQETCETQTQTCVDGVPPDCADDDPCTDDVCNPETGCSNPPTVCSDGNECTQDICYPSVGCQNPNVEDNTACTGGICMDGTCVDTCAGGDTYRFVISRFSAPYDNPDGSASIDDTAPGFDLDDTTADVCGVVDLTWDGMDGVDNGVLRHLGSVLDPIFSSSVNPSIVAGETLIIVEIENVNSVFDDPCVTVNVFFGVTPPLSVDAGAESPLDMDGDGVIDPGVVLDVDGASLDGLGEPLVSGSGSIAGGRVSATVGALELDLADFVLPLEAVELGFAIDPGGTSLSGGVLGGKLPVRAFAIAALTALGDPTCPSVNDQTSATDGDLSPTDPTGGGTGCTDISVGLAFEGVPVTLGETQPGPGGDTGLVDPCDFCGNGTVDDEYGEQCDDGNTEDGDGCSSECT